MVAREALGENTVVSSSALKRSYREALSENVPTFFIHLSGTQELIQQRLNERKGHFMPPALLPSQFAILEPLSPTRTAWRFPLKAVWTPWWNVRLTL